MKRRYLPLVIVLVVFLGFVGCLLYFHRREPTYAGRPLSEWVQGLCQPSGSGFKGAAEDAVLHIGSNAFPYLLKWLTYSRPKWKEMSYRAANPICAQLYLSSPFNDEREELLFCGALSAVAILGPNASGMIPELLAVIHRSTTERPKLAAVGALARIGSGSMQLLIEMIQSSPLLIRIAAITEIGKTGTNAAVAVPVLIECLNKDEGTAASAAEALGRIRLEPTIVIPALTQALRDPRDSVRLSAVAALAEFETEARTALPELLKLREDPWLAVRMGTSNAIRIIANTSEKQ